MPRPLAALALIFVFVAQPLHAQFSKATLLLTGVVTDAESGKPLHARIVFIDPSGVEVNKANTNMEGSYTAVLKPPGTTFKARVSSSKFYTTSEPVTFEQSTASIQASHNFSLKPIHAGTVMFNSDCFDVGSVEPRSDAAAALAATGAAMKYNEEIEVSVETFCDVAADDAPPIAADQGTQRANAIKKILLANGAAPNRVQTKPHNPPPPPPVVEDKSAGKKGKKAKPKKKIVKKTKGKKSATATPPPVKASITITTVHSEDE